MRSPTVDEGYQGPVNPNGKIGLSPLETPFRPIVWKIRHFHKPPSHERVPIRASIAFPHGITPLIDKQSSLLLGWQPPAAGSPPEDAGWVVGVSFLAPNRRRPLSDYQAAAAISGGDTTFVDAVHLQILSEGLLVCPLPAAQVRALSRVAGDRGPVLTALMRPRNAAGWYVLRKDHLALWMRCKTPSLYSPTFSL